MGKYRVCYGCFSVEGLYMETITNAWDGFTEASAGIFGFEVRLKNGLRVSTMWGPANLCSNRGRTIRGYELELSKDAEVSVYDQDGKNITKSVFEELSIDVDDDGADSVPPELWIAMIHYMSRKPPLT